MSFPDAEVGERRNRDRNPECRSRETGTPIREDQWSTGAGAMMGDGCRAVTGVDGGNGEVEVATELGEVRWRPCCN